MCFLMSKMFRVRLRRSCGDGGHAVALLDGEARDRQVGAVESDQRDVGSVQRGDKR